MRTSMGSERIISCMLSAWPGRWFAICTQAALSLGLEQLELAGDRLLLLWIHASNGFPEGLLVLRMKGMQHIGWQQFNQPLQFRQVGWGRGLRFLLGFRQKFQDTFNQQGILLVQAIDKLQPVALAAPDRLYGGPDLPALSLQAFQICLDLRASSRTSLWRSQQ